MKKFRVAILGIRGAVGQCMYRILQERNFPIEKLVLISPSGAGGEIDGNPFVPLTKDVFKGIDIVLSSPGAEISKDWSPIAAQAGAVVIDNTSQFRLDPDVPLVVPEVNPEDILKHKGIIANPNCSTIQMLVALKPLHDFGQINRIIVATYQAVSGAGAEAVEELDAQQQGGKEVKKFKYRIANNLIPQIDDFTDNFYTKEEMKMFHETRKILHDPSIRVSATCVRVPVFNGHSESVCVETHKKITRAKAVELLSKAPGVKVVDDVRMSLYPLPINADGRDETFVGRIREDLCLANGICLWVVADNLRKGAALNAVQIAEILIKN